MATAQELRELKPEELADRAKELKRSLFDMKSKHNTGVLDSTADLGKARKDVARLFGLGDPQQILFTGCATESK